MESIQNARDVKVISLCPYMLNLSTLGCGQGKIYSFKYFGEPMIIPHDDLKEIIIWNKKFLEDGYFYIEDNDFILELELKKTFNTISSKQEIENLFACNPREFKQSFQWLLPKQRETFIYLLTEKIIAESYESINEWVFPMMELIMGEDVEYDVKNDIRNRKYEEYQPKPITKELTQILASRMAV